jgi:hypothetical protein
MSRVVPYLNHTPPAKLVECASRDSEDDKNKSPPLFHEPSLRIFTMRKGVFAHLSEDYYKSRPCK